jgi:formylmethanofuran dehydrogenase subunit C
MTNAGAISLNDDITLAGGISVMGGDVQLNGNITSTATGNLFFQGLSDTWSIRLATGKTIEKTDGTGLLTMQGDGRINNGTSVGSILASGSARLDVVIINEMDAGQHHHQWWSLMDQRRCQDAKMERPGCREHRGPR